MERARLREIFDALYSDVEGYRLSHQERNRLGTNDRSFVYGEVTADGFLDVLAQAEPVAGETFYDLGSGTGRAVFLAALAFPFAKLVGIELLGTLHQAASAVLTRFDAEVRPSLPVDQARRIALRAGDFLAEDLSEADIVFMHSNCFEPPVMKALVQRFEGLRSGARILALGQFLGAPHLSLVTTGPCDLEWGESHYALYRRV